MRKYRPPSRSVKEQGVNRHHVTRLKTPSTNFDCPPSISPPYQLFLEPFHGMLKALTMWDDLSRTKSHHNHHAQNLGD
jgi:hypothetical protein